MDGLRSASKKVFQLLCLIGLIFQIIMISSKYFEYKTNSRLRATFFTNIRVPNVIICFRYSDILDYRKLNEETGLNLNRSERQVYLIMSQVTVGQILQYTPAETELLQSITYRINNSYRVYNLKGSETKSLVKISKFYQQESICYSLQFNNSHRTIEFIKTANAPSSTGFLYHLKIGDAFNGSDVIQVSLSKGVYEIDSIIYSPVFFRLKNYVKRKESFTEAALTFAWYRIERLPIPWDTNCDIEVYPGDSKCWIPCLEKGLSDFGVDRLPFYTRYFDPIDRKPLSHIDLQNETLDRAFVEMGYDLCRKCWTTPCSEEFATTTLIHKSLFARQQEFSIKIMAPEEPDIDIMAEKSLSFEEFVIYISSCVGIWFGISINQLDPFKAMRRWNSCGSGKHSDGI